MTAWVPPAEARFTELMNEHGRAVLGYLARRTEPQHASADLMADVFVVVWRRLDDVPTDPAQARAWLIGIARGVLTNHRRGNSRRDQLANRLRQHLRTQPVAVPDDTTSAVRAALDRLSADDRELLTLIAWEDLTPAQAAAALGLSAAATRKRLERARARLRAVLDSAAPVRAGTTSTG
ncbi:RNA polymerase ECF family sigma subunit [Asanoa ferruginea]|uniref:RNA polymerase ECF family sigma subunit n=1 Tax=Asanoa ferruginea TaxID=53367 RepID=A0A3D9ZE24_9ACTN|nr:sigma-70 family RNA polymerase sigma factor [Asanoa ferruginea]REF95515.1 RNA polymerase ECF family sigma subunit [Asanoa ferruginea]GIF46783.1 siderophore-interacting protein [Asanoa ferruginea]